MTDTADCTSAPALVVGFGAHGRAVVTALVQRGCEVVVADDHADHEQRAVAERLGVAHIGAPAPDQWDDLVAAAAVVLPTPGLPERHPAFRAAQRKDAAVAGELDLARAWDDRPVVAITGTDGKTTVTMATAAMLVASGVTAIPAGNTELPLVTAIDDPVTDVFVVEASSFRLAAARRFVPHVGTWLNFGPDHLDVHDSLASYETAKAKIWRDQGPGDLAIGNAEDPIVSAHLTGPARVERFGLHTGDHRLVGDELVVGGVPVATTGELWRALPHDITNLLAAAATARGAGASIEGIRRAILDFRGLPHRVQLVGEHDGVRWYDDSKATTPHAVEAAVAGFDSVVLLAGGRNKGLDLGPLAGLAPRLRGVVALGEAAPEVEAALAGRATTVAADSMADAVVAAAGMARRGDVVLLSPGCASFDWYGGYAERGDDFARRFGELVRSGGDTDGSQEPGGAR